MLRSSSLSAKYIALVVVFVGVLMAAVDTTVVVLALPTIDIGLHASPISSVWVILTYILVITVLSSQVGRIGDRYGRVRLYKYGLFIFVIGSALCGIAPNINFLNGSRTIQAVGGALLGTASGAVISDYFEPHERGRAFGYTSIGWNFGAMLGIFLGGLLAAINWRLIFYINVPIGLAVLALALYKLHDISKPAKEPIDILGAFLLGIGLLALALDASFSMFEGFTIHEVLLFVMALIFIAAFIARELRVKYPTIDFALFNNRVFGFSVFASMMQFTATFAILFILILYLQGVRGLDPFTSSLYLLPGYLIGGIFAPSMGRLSDRIGARIPATIGLLTIAVGFFLYIMLLGVNSPLYYVAVVTIFTGVGSAMFYPSNNSAIMAHAPKERYAMASGLNRMLGNIGMVLSFAISLTVASSTVPRQTTLAIFSGSDIVLSKVQGALFMHGIDYVFIASIAIILVAAILSAARGKEDRRAVSEMHRKEADG